MHYLLSLFLMIYGIQMPVAEHDIHVSVTDIEISEGGEIEITIKVFLDDLMNSLGLEQGAELPDDYTSSDELIKTFIGDNLSLSINGAVIELVLEETTPSLPAVWINMTGKIEGQLESVEVNNKILVDLFDDQSNMVNIYFADKKYAELLDGKETNWAITL